MKRFLIRRIATALATAIAVSVVIFLLARVSGDPRSVMLGDAASQEQWDEMGVILGLDQPLPVQYGRFIGRAMVGDFGRSVSHNRPALDVIMERLPATLELALVAFTLSTMVGVCLGVLTAVRKRTTLDRIGQGIALIGQAMPAFWLGIMLIFVFAVGLSWLPPSGRQEWSSFILPSVTLGWFFVAANMRLVRSSMLDALSMDYIKMARAKGLRWRTVILKHALRNALIAPLTYAGVTLGSLVTGSLVVETVFAWPGLGQLAVSAVFRSDYALLQATVIFFTVIYLAAALLVDVLYAFIDPRVRYA